jgi:hypothetical protein
MFNILRPLNVEARMDCPNVILDADIPKMEISGKSFPPDVFLFYDPVINWLDEYLKNPSKETVFELKLDYFNTASSKVLLDILFKFRELNNKGLSILIKWYYPDDDEDMMETGLQYAMMTRLPFEHIAYSTEFK